MRGRLGLLVCVLACAVSGSLAWGSVGHQIVASIASSLLSDNCADCAADVQSILGDQTMEDVATWADSIRYSAGWEWTAPLHYADTPDWACKFDYSRDCADAVCVVGAITNFTKQINPADGAPPGDVDWQLDSLKFVIHFVGDVHQPLHVGFASDEGGNDIDGTFEGDSDNLHYVWDSALLYKRIDDDFSGDQDQYASYLLGEIGGDWADKAAEWAKCPDGELACPEQWASESSALACSHAYTDSEGKVVQNGFVLGDAYYDFNSAVIDQQLAKAAVRLAATLTRVFQSGSRSAATVLPANL